MATYNHIKNISILDINKIILIENEAYRKPWTRNHFENDIKNKQSINFMYKKNNEIIAYLFGYLIDDEYHLNKITVKKTYRGKKIGKILFDYCLDELLLRGVRSIQLEVSSLNLVAQKFYKSLDFLQVGIRKKYYSEDADALLYNLEVK